MEVSFPVTKRTEEGGVTRFHLGEGDAFFDVPVSQNRELKAACEEMHSLLSKSKAIQIRVDKEACRNAYMVYSCTVVCVEGGSALLSAGGLKIFFKTRGGGLEEEVPYFASIHVV